MRMGEVRGCGVVLDYMCMSRGGYPLNVGGDFLYMQHSVNFFSLAKA